MGVPELALSLSAALSYPSLPLKNSWEWSLALQGLFCFPLASVYSDVQWGWKQDPIAPLSLAPSRPGGCVGPEALPTPGCSVSKSPTIP